MRLIKKIIHSILVFWGVIIIFALPIIFSISPGIMCAVEQKGIWLWWLLITLPIGATIFGAGMDDKWASKWDKWLTHILFYGK
jgi:hypothetical protein